ncbi:MAG: protein kinase [Actinobacteria bacterium]|nr:protein kinase [Actinomycetota bacterium]
MSTGDDTDVIGDRFHLHERIGAGGMAQVFRATDSELDRDVAVKLVDLRTDLDGEVRRRIQQEARRAAQLRHPGVVQVHDVGNEEGRAYIVMEYVTGPTLADELDRVDRFPEHEVAQIGRQICEALRVAHEAGVVHRDIKPGNVLLDDGRARITDFGIAHAVGDTITDDTVRGTAGYLAPEQLGDGEADHRADLYALGVLLYELATGRRPFVGETATETAFQRLHKDHQPPSEIAPVSAAFDRFIDRALARAPDDRFQSAEEMHTALEPLTVDPEGDTQPLAFVEATDDEDDPEGGRRSWWWLGLGLLATLLVAAAVTVGPRLLPGRSSEVPDLSGLTVAAASRMLEHQGLHLGAISRQPSDRPAGTVLEQVPEPGAPAPDDGTVDLVVAEAPGDPASPSETPSGSPPPDDPTTSQDGTVDTSDGGGDSGTGEQPAEPGGGPPDGRGPDGDGPPGQDGEPPGKG